MKAASSDVHLWTALANLETVSLLGRYVQALLLGTVLSGQLWLSLETALLVMGMVLISSENMLLVPDTGRGAEMSDMATVLPSPKTLLYNPEFVFPVPEVV